VIRFRAIKSENANSSVKAEMSNPGFSGPGPEEASLPDWYQLFLEAKERLKTQDSTILELIQKSEEMET
jgi:hypothetical protein